MTWIRTKIQFINDLAKEWGGIIEDASIDQCYAPNDSSDVEVISLCQNMTVDVIQGNEEAISQLRN